MKIQVENFEAAIPELKTLLDLHWEELALDKDAVKLNPMFEVYIEREQAGELLFVSVRDGGVLVGYFIGFIAPGLHYRDCLTCTMDILYLLPHLRKSNLGNNLLNAVEYQCHNRGVQRMFVGSKLHQDIGPFFEKRGFTPIETYYSKLLEAR